MKRKEFLRKLGLGAAFVLTTSCFGGCSKEAIDTGPVQLELDLADPQYASLLTKGNYIVIDKSVVVARTTDGEYVAATVVCSHEDKKKIILNNDEWFCTDHDARFSLSGEGLNSKGSKGLAIYNTSLNGDILTVYS